MKNHSLALFVWPSPYFNKMHFDLNVFQLLIILSSVNGAAWALLIFRKKKKNKVNIFLAAFIFVFALAGLKIVLQEHFPAFNSLLPVPLLYQFTFGPLLYLFVKRSLDPVFRLSWQLGWHFLPSLLLDVLPVLLFFLFYREHHPAQTAKISFILDILAFLTFTGYGLVSWRLIRQNPAKSRWTTRIGVAIVLIATTWLLYILWVIILKGHALAGMLPYYPVYLVLAFYVYSLGIAGYYRLEIGLLEIPTIEKKERMPDRQLQVRTENLLARIREQHYYRDENLNLQNLATLLDMPVRDLSYLLNTGLVMSFTDLINELRVEDFKQRLGDPRYRHYTLLGMAYDSGFSSKASFYRIFKKATGLTPAEFYKSQQGDNEKKVS